MTDLSDSAKLVYKAKHKIRFVTAASLFDGHDASINIMRRILQSSGAEVIHLGHNRSVDEIVTAALQEDVQGIAVSSYQGGHVEFFKYMIELLRARGGAPIQVFGGGGGVIVPSEIKELQDCGVARIYSLGTRATGSELSAATADAIAACKAAGYQLVIVETAGIGQGDAAIVPHADVTLYVMTPEFGAASQLEKIDMLDFADFVAINKYDRKGAEDALRDVRKQVQRNREAFREPPDAMPVFGTIAARFNDDGVTALYHALADALSAKGLKLGERRLPRAAGKVSSNVHVIIPAKRQRYLAEIAESVRGYHETVREQSRLA